MWQIYLPGSLGFENYTFIHLDWFILPEWAKLESKPTKNRQNRQGL